MERPGIVVSEEPDKQQDDDGSGGLRLRLVPVRMDEDGVGHRGHNTLVAAFLAPVSGRGGTRQTREL